ncbi:Uncharacterised protein [Vibrio cholerae]|uniref:Uncharacterized protein n=1 Tax=Vibrio cholerae TaxID=666 RepID=A0A655PTE1_VIBCL|nr:Uncharacterised protein [Vibrio cholerae]CSB40996.1 Uncharacterised protein [Vibrio cholerae]
MSTSPCPVIKITGISDCTFFNATNRLNPSVSGRRTSLTTAAKLCCSIAANADAPSANIATSKPASCNHWPVA